MKRNLFAIFLALTLVVALAFVVAPTTQAATVLTPANAPDGKITVSTAGQILDLQGEDLTVTLENGVELSVIDTTIRQSANGSNNAGTLTVTGDGSIADMSVDPDSKMRFLAVDNGSTYSFYPFNMTVSLQGINTLAKNPDEGKEEEIEPAAALRVSFVAFKPVIEKIEAYGFIVDGEKHPATKEFNDNIVHAYANLLGSLRDDRIDVSKSVQAYMTINGVDYTSAERSFTPREILKGINKDTKVNPNKDQMGRIEALFNAEEGYARVKNILTRLRANEGTETLSFATTANRVSLDVNTQVWATNGVTLTNNKSSSTTNIADYSNPIRFYKDSQIVVEAKGIKKIVFNLTGESKYKVWNLKSTDDYTVERSGDVVTVTFINNPTDQFTATMSDGQVRMSSIVVTFNAAPACQHIANRSEASCTAKAICYDCDKEHGGLEDHVEKTAATCTSGPICENCGEEYDDALGHNYVDGECTVCYEEDPNADKTPETLATFVLGADGSASHKDSNSSKTTYNETVNGYTLNITGGTNMYPSSLDAKGNSCIKLGTSSKTGGFSFTVGENVTSVTICIAKYKSNTTKITVNGTAYTLAKNSNDGAYDEITIDTTNTKTISLTTVSGGVRAMVNTIEFTGFAN